MKWLGLAIGCSLTALWSSDLRAQPQGAPIPRATATMTRTDSAGVSHLVIDIVTPAEDDRIGPYAYAIAYGWIQAGRVRLHVDACAPREDEDKNCKYGFPIVRGQFHPGDHIGMALDLPTAFVTATGAELWVAVGGDKAYMPTKVIPATN